MTVEDHFVDMPVLGRRGTDECPPWTARDKERWCRRWGSSTSSAGRNVISIVLCLLLVFSHCCSFTEGARKSNLSSSSAYRAWRGNHRNRAASIRSRLHTRPTQLLSSVASGASSPEAGRPSAEELPVPASLRAASSPRPRESRLLGLGSISSPFGMLSNSLVSTSELLFKLIDDSQPQVTSNQRMDTGLKKERKTTGGKASSEEDRAEKRQRKRTRSKEKVAAAKEISTKRVKETTTRRAKVTSPSPRTKTTTARTTVETTTKRARSKKAKTTTTTTLSTTPVAPVAARITTTLSSADLPMEHRTIDDGVEIFMDFDVGKRNEENTRRAKPGAGVRMRVKPRRKGAKDEKDVMRLNWKQGQKPRSSSAPTKLHNWRVEHPTIVCSNPLDCPEPIHELRPVYHFGGQQQRARPPDATAVSVLPPAFNTKATTVRAPVNGKRRYKPFMRKKYGVKRRRKNETLVAATKTKLPSVPGLFNVPVRVKPSDFKKVDTEEVIVVGVDVPTATAGRPRLQERPTTSTAKGTTSTEATVESTVKAVNHFMFRKTTPKKTTTQSVDGQSHTTTNSDSGRRRRPPAGFRGRRPTSSTSLSTSSGTTTAPFELIKVAEGGAKPQQRPLDMVKMKEMSLTELQKFMEMKGKGVKKMLKKKVVPVKRPAPLPATMALTPGPTSWASTTSFPAVPGRTTNRPTQRKNAHKRRGGAKFQRLPSTPKPTSWASTTSFPAVPHRATIPKRHRNRSRTPKPTSLASTTSFPAVPNLNANRVPSFDPVALLNEEEEIKRLQELLPTKEEMFMKQNLQSTEAPSMSPASTTASTSTPPDSTSTTPLSTTPSTTTTTTMTPRPTRRRPTSTTTTAQTMTTTLSTTTKSPRRVRTRPTPPRSSGARGSRNGNRAPQPTPNNLDMVLKFMGGQEMEDDNESPVGGGGGDPLQDFTLMSMGLPTDDESLSAMMSMTEFGLKDGVKAKLGTMRTKLKEQMMKKKKNELRRRPAMDVAMPATTESPATSTISDEKFPHYPSKTPYASTPSQTDMKDEPTPSPTSELSDSDMDLEQMLEEMNAVRQLEELMMLAELAPEKKPKVTMKEGSKRMPTTRIRRPRPNSPAGGNSKPSTTKMNEMRKNIIKSMTSGRPMPGSNNDLREQEKENENSGNTRMPMTPPLNPFTRRRRPTMKQTFKPQTTTTSSSSEGTSAEAPVSPMDETTMRVPPVNKETASQAPSPFSPLTSVSGGKDGVSPTSFMSFAMGGIRHNTNFFNSMMAQHAMEGGNDAADEGDDGAAGKGSPMFRPPQTFLPQTRPSRPPTKPPRPPPKPSRPPAMPPRPVTMPRPDLTMPLGVNLPDMTMPDIHQLMMTEDFTRRPPMPSIMHEDFTKPPPRPPAMTTEFAQDMKSRPPRPVMTFHQGPETNRPDMTFQRVVANMADVFESTKSHLAPSAGRPPTTQAPVKPPSLPVGNGATSFTFQSMGGSKKGSSSGGGGLKVVPSSNVGFPSQDFGFTMGEEGGVVDGGIRGTSFKIPSGDAEKIEFETSQALLDLRQKLKDMEKATTTEGHEQEQSFVDFGKDILKKPLEVLNIGSGFDSGVSHINLGPADEGKKMIPRPFDDPYKNYFNGGSLFSADEEERLKYSSVKTTPHPRPEPFTVRVRPTGKPISVMTERPTHPTLKPFFGGSGGHKTPFTVRPTNTGTKAFPQRPMNSKPTGRPPPHRLPKPAGPASSFQSFKFPLGYKKKANAIKTTIPPHRPYRPAQSPLQFLPPPPPLQKHSFNARPPSGTGSSQLAALRAKLKKPQPFTVRPTSSRPEPESKPFSIDTHRPTLKPFTVRPTKKPVSLEPFTLRYPTFDDNKAPSSSLFSRPSLFGPNAFPAKPTPVPNYRQTFRPTTGPTRIIGSASSLPKQPFTVRPKSTIVPHNFVQPANIKVKSKPVFGKPPAGFRPKPPSPPVPLPPKRFPLPPVTYSSPSPHRPTLKPVESKRPGSLGLLHASSSSSSSGSAANLNFDPDIFDDYDVSLLDPSMFDEPLYYGLTDGKDLAAKNRPTPPPHKAGPPSPEGRDRPATAVDPPPPAPFPKEPTPLFGLSSDDYDYLSALYDEYPQDDLVLFPGQHDDRPPGAPFKPGFDKFPKFDDGVKKPKATKDGGSGDFPNVFIQAHRPIESLLRDLPETDQDPDFPRKAGSTPHTAPPPPKPPKNSKAKPPPPPPPVGVVPPPHMRGKRLPKPQKLKRPRTAHHPLPHPPRPIGSNYKKKPKLPKMDKDLLDFVSSIPGMMQKLVSNPFTGRDLKAYGSETTEQKVPAPEGTELEASQDENYDDEESYTT